MRTEEREKKRVLYVELNTDGTIGGSYFSLYYLVAGLDKSKFEPTVVFAAPTELLEKYLNAGIRTWTLTPRVPLRPGKWWLVPVTKFANFTWAKIHSVLSIVKYLRLLRSERVDLLHLNNSVDIGHEWMIAASVLGVPCVTHQRGFLSKCTVWTRLLSRKLAAVICVSTSVKQNLVEFGIRNQRLVSIHNGLDADAIQVSRNADDIRKELGIDASAFIIGMVGNIQRWKGQDVVIKAMMEVGKTHPEVVCVLLGAISTRNTEDMEFGSELMDVINKNNLNGRVVMAGYRPDVANYVNAFEILIHASVHPEPFGRVLLEGMAQRKPLIASRAGGVEEIVVSGETGLLYRSGDSHELANCLLSLVENKEKRHQMGEAGFQRLQSCFSISHNVETTTAMYQSILDNK